VILRFLKVNWKPKKHKDKQTNVKCHLMSKWTKMSNYDRLKELRYSRQKLGYE